MLVSMRTSVPDQGNSLSRMLTILKSSMGNIITLNPFEVGDKDGLYIWSFGMSAPDDVAHGKLHLVVTRLQPAGAISASKTSVNVQGYCEIWLYTQTSTSVVSPGLLEMGLLVSLGY